MDTNSLIAVLVVVLVICIVCFFAYLLYETDFFNKINDHKVNIKSTYGGTT